MNALIQYACRCSGLKPINIEAIFILQQIGTNSVSTEFC